MKKATIHIYFDAEKLTAIRQYMGKKDSELQSELNDVMHKLYEKHVPPTVREYIERRDAEGFVNSKKAPRPVISTARDNLGGSND